MSALRGLVAGAALLFAAAPSLADEVERTIIVTWADAEGDAEAHISAQLPNWLVAAASRAATVPWDAKECGPFDIVDRRAKLVVVDRNGPHARVTLKFEDAGLPSGQAAADTYAARVAVGCRILARESLAARCTERMASAQPRIDRFDARVAQLRREQLALEDGAGGDATELLAAARERLRAVATELAASRTLRASVTKRLDAARRAAKQAAELEKARREAERLTGREDLSPEDRQALEALHRRIDELSQSCPSLESAREQVFALELDLLDQEARDESLTAEAAALRAEIARLRGFASTQRSIEAELAQTESDLREIRREAEIVAARYERAAVDVVVHSPR